jgi:hypothetical protein
MNPFPPLSETQDKNPIRLILTQPVNLSYAEERTTPTIRKTGALIVRRFYAMK